jgi:hypothetical protein
MLGNLSHAATTFSKRTLQILGTLAFYHAAEAQTPSTSAISISPKVPQPLAVLRASYADRFSSGESRARLFGSAFEQTLIEAKRPDLVIKLAALTQISDTPRDLALLNALSAISGVAANADFRYLQRILPQHKDSLLSKGLLFDVQAINSVDPSELLQDGAKLAGKVNPHYGELLNLAAAILNIHKQAENADIAKNIRGLDRQLYPLAADLGASLARMYRNPEFRKTEAFREIDKELRILGITPDFSFSQILKKVSADDQIREVLELLDQEIAKRFKDQPPDEEQLRAVIAQFSGEVTSLEERLNQKLADLERKLQGTDDNSMAISKRMSREMFEYLVNEVQGAFQIVSMLWSFKDQKTAAQIAVVGNEMGKIAKALYAFQTGTIGPLGYYGIILGAAFTISDMMNDQPDLGTLRHKMILEALDTINSNIDQARREMHSRFDRVDLALSKISGTLQEVAQRQFWERVDSYREFRIVLDNIRRQDSFSVSADRSARESAITTIMDPLHRSRDRLNTMVGLAPTVPIEKTLTEQVFVDMISEFATAGVSSDRALHPTVRGANVEYEPSRLLEVLQSKEEQLFGFYPKIAKQVPHVSSLSVQEDLVNPIEWAIAADSYIRLRITAPFAVPPDWENPRIDRMIKEGEKLDSAVRAWGNGKVVELL